MSDSNSMARKELPMSKPMFCRCSWLHSSRNVLWSSTGWDAHLLVLFCYIHPSPAHSFLFPGSICMALLEWTSCCCHLFYAYRYKWLGWKERSHASFLSIWHRQMADQFVTMMTLPPPDERPSEVTALQVSEFSGATGLGPGIFQFCWAVGYMSCIPNTSEEASCLRNNSFIPVIFLL